MTKRFLQSIFIAFVMLLLVALTLAASPNLMRTNVRGHWGLEPVASTLAGTQTLTPTASFYLMSPATTLTLTLATGNAVAGDTIIIMSQVATDTVIIDTTCTVGGGNITLGTDGDVWGGRFDGSKWCQEFAADNS